MNGPITWDIISAFVVFGGGVLLVWWRIEKRIEKAETAAERRIDMVEAAAENNFKDRGDEIIAVSKDLAGYKLSASERYASNEHLKEVEVRLTGAIDRLTNRIEQLPSKFAEEVARLVGTKPTRRS